MSDFNEEILAKLGISIEEAKALAEEFYMQRDMLTMLLAQDPLIQAEVNDALRSTDKLGITSADDDEVEKRVSNVFCLGYMMAIATGKVVRMMADKVKNKLMANKPQGNPAPSAEIQEEDKDWYNKLFGAN